jgi:2,3-bisphosphoglycerate-independent phosphoglycerate mutase
VTQPDHVLFVFLDGVGLGPPDEDLNPLSRTRPGFAEMASSWTDAFEPLDTDRHVARAIDATLGVPGLPQSGTGQATLFTGENCARIAGRHFGPFPHSTSRPILSARNLFLQVGHALGRADACAFANAYPDRFFTYMRTRDRWTVTTRSCLDAGLRIRSRTDLLDGNAIAADITAEGWPEPGITPISEIEAASRLASITLRHRLTVFEVFHTDKAGHSGDRNAASSILDSLGRFFDALISVLGENVLLIVTSDHGNLEDLSTRSHTLNPVPLVARGPGARAFAGVTDLTGVTPGILRSLAPVG